MAPLEEPTKPVMPREAKTAIAFLILPLVFGVLRYLSEPILLDPRLPSWFAPLIAAMTLGIVGYLIYLIATGRRWALIVFIALFLLGLPSSVEILANYDIWRIAIAAIQVLLTVAAFFLLFMKASREWFVESRAYRKARKHTNKAAEPIS